MSCFFVEKGLISSTSTSGAAPASAQAPAVFQSRGVGGKVASLGGLSLRGQPEFFEQDTS